MGEDDHAPRRHAGRPPACPFTPAITGGPTGIAGRALGLALGALALVACEQPPEPAAQYTIGLVTNNRNGLRNVAGFKAAMEELGYVEGENATYLSADGPVPKAELEAELQRLVDARVDLVFTAGTPTGVAAHRVTAGSGIPVVFGVIADPVAAGVLEDLNRPGGNMTGVKLSQNQARRLQLLQELVPGVRRVLVPFNPTDAAPTSAYAQVEAVAPALGIELVKGEVRSAEAVTALLRELPADVDAVFLVPDSTVNPRLGDVLEAANARGIPVSGPSTAQVEEGAFMTYGFVHREAGARAARIAEQVLRGTRAGDLPVQTAEFHLGINLKTARALGIEVSGDVLDRAGIIVR